MDRFGVGDNFTKWEPEDGGWALRVISVVTEWVMASFLVLYFITFIPEFKKISLTSGPRVRKYAVPKQSKQYNSKLSKEHPSSFL
jgi:hypothetical protein